MRIVLAVLLVLVMAAPAEAAKQCAEPGPGDWERATPAEAGMDAGKLAAALDYGTSQASYAVRVYRHGCLVGEDDAAAVNRNTRFESWSKAKSITSLVYGRAATLGLISPADPMGALIQEADAEHGAIRVRDLLTMTSGLEWNGFRDYNIAMPNRIRDALTTPVAKPPGTYWEYSQSGPALLAETVQRAVGEDFQAFAQRELFTPLGILPGTWSWKRDAAGHTQGFFGVEMVPDDYARLGELMRRGGVWQGRRLLSRRYLREALTPVKQSGCYGYLIWLNSAQPCVGVRISERAVRDRRMFPDAPADLYTFSGLFGQIVTVMPSQGIVVERNGQDPSQFGGGDWEAELYRRVLAAVTDEPFTPPADPPATAAPSREDPDRGFQTSFTPDALAPLAPAPELPPAGPARARAVRLGYKILKKRFAVSVACPPALGTGRCDGTVRLGKTTKRFALAAGTRTSFRFRKRGRVVRARVDDAAGGVTSRLGVRPRRK